MYADALEGRQTQTRANRMDVTIRNCQRALDHCISQLIQIACSAVCVSLIPSRTHTSRMEHDSRFENRIASTAQYVQQNQDVVRIPIVSGTWISSRAVRRRLCSMPASQQISHMTPAPRQEQHSERQRWRLHRGGSEEAVAPTETAAHAEKA